MIRPTLAVVLVLLVVIAGCVGPTDGENEDRGTPTSVAETRTDVATLETGPGASYPPGYSHGGIDNVTRALRTHDAALNDTSSYHLSFSLEAGEKWVLSVEHDVGGNGTYATFRKNDTLTREVYRTHNGTTTRDTSGRGATYLFFSGGSGRDSISTIPLSFPDRVLRSTLPALSYNNVSTVTVDGMPYYEYEIEGINESNTMAESDRSRNVTAGVVRVDAQGRIRNVTLATENETRPGLERIVLRYRVTDIGRTNGTAPAWIQNAPRVTGTAVEDGHVIRLVNHGPGTIPADTYVAPGRYVNAPEIGHPVEPGESVYVSLRPGEERTQILFSKSRPDDDRVGPHFRTMRDEFNDPEGAVSLDITTDVRHRAIILVELEG